MSDKKILFGFIIFNLYLIYINCFTFDSFSKSIYAYINETQDIYSIGKKSEIKTEYLILKYEKPLKNLNISHNDKISFYLNSKYYHNIISLDTKNKMDFYTLKNNFVSRVTNANNKKNNPYTIIEDENHFILERLEYIDEKLHLEDKKKNLIKDFWYNLINEKPLNNTNRPLLQDLITDDLIEIDKAIKENFNKISKWTKDNSYELFFVYDKLKNKFILHKIFIYFIKGENKICQINLRYLSAKNALFEQGNKIYKNFYNKNTISNTDYMNSTQYKLKISTNKKDSIYHNLMTLTINNQTLNNVFKKSIDNNICILIHYILTEDVYIERNEFIKRFEEILISKGLNKNLLKENITYDLFASKFIEQELSSDLSGQAYFNFLICTNKNILDVINNTISFTIHYRYQPSMNSNSNKTHQITFMPQPFVYIFNSSTSNEKMILDEFIYKNNIVKEENNNNKDNMEIFEEEIKLKKLNIINQVNILNENYDELIHEIPAGQKKYFLVVTLITIITSIAGFFIILYGVMNYISANERYDKMKKIE